MQRVRSATWCVLLAAAILPVNAAAAGKGAPPAAKHLITTNASGCDNSVVLSGSALRLVVAPECGARVLEYSINGENALFASSASSGDNVPGPGQQFQLCAPSGNTIKFGQSPWQTSPLGEAGLKLRSSINPESGAQLEQDILMDPETGDVGISLRVRNGSKKEAAYSLRDHTLCKGGGFAFFVLKKKSQIPARWALQRQDGAKSVFDGMNPKAPQIRLLENLLVAQCEGERTTLASDTDAGWVGYVRGKWLLIKYFPYSSKARYPESGHTLRVSFDEQTADLQPLSPEVKLKAGETYEFPEQWTLIELDARVTSFEEVKSLAERIPPSPFD